MVSSRPLLPARRMILSLLIGSAMLLPLGYQLYVVTMMLVGWESDSAY